MIAVISDIHANLEALDAVLEDAGGQGVEAIYCLGDVLGYGPSPIECVERAMAWDLVLLGNHDNGVLHPPDGFSVIPERAVFWHREVIQRAPNGDRLWAFLEERPRNLRQGESSLRSRFGEESGERVRLPGRRSQSPETRPARAGDG